MAKNSLFQKKDAIQNIHRGIQKKIVNSKKSSKKGQKLPNTIRQFIYKKKKKKKIILRRKKMQYKTYSLGKNYVFEERHQKNVLKESRENSRIKRSGSSRFLPNNLIPKTLLYPASPTRLNYLTREKAPFALLSRRSPLDLSGERAPGLDLVASSECTRLARSQQRRKDLRRASFLLRDYISMLNEGHGALDDDASHSPWCHSHSDRERVPVRAEAVRVTTRQLVHPRRTINYHGGVRARLPYASPSFTST